VKKESSRNNISDLGTEIKVGDLCYHLNDMDNDILLILELIPIENSFEAEIQEALYKQGHYRCLSSNKRLYNILGIHLRKI